MKMIFKLLSLSIIIAIAISCKSSSDKEMAVEEISQGSDAMAPPAPQMKQSMTEPSQQENIYDPLITERKIIRDGNMEIRVKDVEEGKNKVDTLVKRYKAYYSNESKNNTDYARGYTLTIRVPAASFDDFLMAIETGAGEVVYKNISSRDVTEEFIDIETRLANKRAYIQRYTELLKKAASVKDILEIQDKLRIIEEEVESAQGRLKYLNNQVDYSTLTLQITKKNDYNIYSNSNQGTFFDRLKISLVKGWFGLVSFVLLMIRIWPFWIIAGFGYYFYRKIRRNIKK